MSFLQEPLGVFLLRFVRNQPLCSQLIPTTRVGAQDEDKLPPPHHPSTSRASCSVQCPESLFFHLFSFETCHEDNVTLEWKSYRGRAGEELQTRKLLPK